MRNYKLIQGDSRKVLETLSDKSVQCGVTSPPYYGLRDYGIDGQIGLEKSPEEYIEHLVCVFSEFRRVLKDDGTLWLNLGDSYNGSGGAGGDYSVGGLKEGQPKYPGRKVSNLKPKDLMMIPARVALALQADGWYLRSEIIWHKPNPMPEGGARDRPTRAHEMIYLLSKSSTYYYDSVSISEKSMDKRVGKTIHASNDRIFKDVGVMNHQTRIGLTKQRIYKETRNRRDVWTVTTKPYKEAHFATFPPDLIEPCILAGSRVGDIVLDPFNGSGTTGYVSVKNGRKYIGIELNPSYIALSEKRIAEVIHA